MPRNGYVQQCQSCAVTVSQTKVGICLQFQWRKDCTNQGFSGLFFNQNPPQPVYCSIDIVPTFRVQNVEAMELARYVLITL